MLIIAAAFFAILGVSLLLAAAILQIRLSASVTAVPMNKLALSLASFNLSFPKRFITPDQSHIIALDEAAQSLAVGSYFPDKEEQAAARLYGFDAIIGSELVENALTLSKVSKTSRIITRADSLQPAAEADPKPAAATPEEINELTLKIYLSSEDTPVLSIPFLPGLPPAKKTDHQYFEAYCEARHVHDIIRDIVSA